MLSWFNGTNDVEVGPPKLERIDLDGMNWTYAHLRLARSNSNLKASLFISSSSHLRI